MDEYAAIAAAPLPRPTMWIQLDCMRVLGRSVLPRSSTLKLLHHVISTCLEQLENEVYFWHRNNKTSRLKILCSTSRPLPLRLCSSSSSVYSTRSCLALPFLPVYPVSVYIARLNFGFIMVLEMKTSCLVNICFSFSSLCLLIFPLDALKWIFSSLVLHFAI